MGHTTDHAFPILPEVEGEEELGEDRDVIWVDWDIYAIYIPIWVFVPFKPLGTYLHP